MKQINSLPSLGHLLTIFIAITAIINVSHGIRISQDEEKTEEKEEKATTSIYPETNLIRVDMNHRQSLATTAPSSSSSSPTRKSYNYSNKTSTTTASYNSLFWNSIFLREKRDGKSNSHDMSLMSTPIIRMCDFKMFLFWTGIYSSQEGWLLSEGIMMTIVMIITFRASTFVLFCS